MREQLKADAQAAASRDETSIVSVVVAIEADIAASPAYDWEREFYLGYLKFLLHHWESAADHLHRSLEGHPDNPDTHLLLGLARAEGADGFHHAWKIKRDHTKMALMVAERNLEQGAWNSLKYALDLLVEAATNIGPPEDVEYGCRWLIRLEPENAAHYAKLSQVRADCDLTESVALLEKAHALDANTVSTDELALAQAALQAKSPAKKAVVRSRFPTTDEMSGRLNDVIVEQLLGGTPREAIIRPETRFFALGSCFAREIAKCLQAHGHLTHYFEVSEHINSTFANRHMVEWALESCHGQPKDRLDDLFASMQLTPAAIRDQWSKTDVLIYTLGVAPVFRDRKTHEFIMPRSSSLTSRALAELYEFKTSTVAENLDNLEFIHARLREINPQMRFVITVSPVPLRMTFEQGSAIQADCLSKSTLRVTAHEFVSRHPECIYWPSFEVVRWVGGHVGPFFGIDDGAALHVGDRVVAAITDAFIQHFS